MISVPKLDMSHSQAVRWITGHSQGGLRPKVGKRCRQAEEGLRITVPKSDIFHGEAVRCTGHSRGGLRPKVGKRQGGSRVPQIGVLRVLRTPAAGAHTHPKRGADALRNA
jgi:hypothetical protein